MRRAGMKTILCGALLAVTALLPASASAEIGTIGIADWDGGFVTGEAGVLRAGEHPDLVVNNIQLTSYFGPEGKELPDAGVRDLVAELPAGFLGAPNATGTCGGIEDLTNGFGAGPSCSSNSIVGNIEVRFTQSGLGGTVALYNMRPPTDRPARFGFNIQGVPVVLEADVRAEHDYRIELGSYNTNQGLQFLGATTKFWGVPGDPVHDEERCQQVTCEGTKGDPNSGPNTFNFGLPKAFLTLPTSCSEPGKGLHWGMRVSSWETPITEDTGFFETHLDPPNETTPLGTSRCDLVPFDPIIRTNPTTTEAESPSGLDVRIEIPQGGLNNPEGIAQSHLKDAVVALPEGMTVNPSYGDGVVSCSAAQIGLTSGNSPDVQFNEAPSGCPDAARLADVRIDTPVINEPLIGGAYIAQQNDSKAPGAENPFDSFLAMYMVLEGAGVRIKLAGEINPDPRTGQIVTTFLNNPQLPFERFTLKFKGGQRAPLSTPAICGTFATQATLTPWTRPLAPVTVSDSFQITKGPHDGPCPNGKIPPFKPSLIAGTLNNAAGSYSPFNVRLSREDGEQEFTRFSIKLPPGIIGNLSKIPFCSDAALAGVKGKSGAEELAVPSCPLASEVGRTEVGAGVGSLQVFAPGKIYLAGSYNGSALSIAAITAAKVGPFDLGTVLVRQALKIDPETAEVFVDATGSDPIPHIIDGVVVHARDIRAFIDRPNFMMNPTSCARKSTASTVLGSGLDFASEVDDNPITVTSPFQAADCAALPFKPRLSMKLIGGTKRGDHPKFAAHLKMNGIGEAAIKSAQVTLPHSEFLENAHIKTICTRVQFRKGSVPGEACPANSIYGFAEAKTPILDEPLKGPVFLRSSEHELPDMVAALHNGKININVVGRVDSVKGGNLRNTFDAVPDAPVSEFKLTLLGGKKGLLVNSTNICRRTHRATASFDAHNGKSHDFRPELKAQCKGKAKKGKKKKRRRAAAR